MAACYINEYASIGSGGPGHPYAQAPKEPAVVRQTPIGISGSPTASAVFGNSSNMIRVNVDSTCSILIGPAAVASTNFGRMQAGQTEYFCVQPGHQLSVIANV